VPQWPAHEDTQMSLVRTGFFAGGAALLMAALTLPALAEPAASEVWIWPPEAQAGHPPHAETPSDELNGQLAIASLAGGVGNTYGATCCTGGGFYFAVGGIRRQGMDGDIAFRAARDATFGRSIGGPGIDRAFRFRANSIQSSGF